MIALSTLWFVALFVVGLAMILGGALVAFAAGMASSGGHGDTANRGWLVLLIGVSAFICAIIGLAGGFA